jgi:pyruvate/2-oxoglutarate dehydrogenase complex dihydrolipoamide dehydrogenase (E3) component
VTRIVVMGGGPAGYEAALVAAQHGADVTVVERDGMGGACVLDDCVPSKTFIASAGVRVEMRRADELGVPGARPALAQSADVRARLEREGIRIVRGSASFAGESRAGTPHLLEARTADGSVEELPADVVLIATGASPRVLDDARPDGERILTWRQLYDLPELPEHLVVVGSGVTGAEFCSAYVEMGSAVTLVSSRDRVLPGEDADAAAVLQDVFAERGVTIMAQARAESVERVGDGVVVTLADGRTVTGSHALMTVGSIPNTANLGLDKVGIETDRGGFIPVDRVSRTSVSGVYAAGDCTGVLMLASVAAMQGRIAMWHALGEGVAPIKLKTVAAAVFTRPEIATVGISQRAIDAGEVPARTIMLPLATNPRAKMLGLRRGFVKLFCRPATGVIVGGVVVAPVASELILPIAMAVQNGLTVEDLAHTFSVYPSMSGSITESGRQLMRHGDLD